MKPTSLRDKLVFLYGEEKGAIAATRLEKLLQENKIETEATGKNRWDEKDIALVTYANSFGEKGTLPLKTLYKFLQKYIGNKLNIIHILPFYPYSSDRGFSIIDSYQVNKQFGRWEDIKKIAENYRLMADLVANHVSAKSRWFREFLKVNKKYQDYFIWFTKENLPSPELLSKVRRGRATSVLTPFETKEGLRYLWTTYSVGDTSDQIDLNYCNPEVLYEVVAILLNLLKKGVRLIRLDGAGGLWKELGTICKHLPKTHELIKILRIAIQETCPTAIVFTETTTATYEERIKYLCDDEASVIYNFDIAPLILYSFYTSSAVDLSSFIRRLRLPSSQCTYFNILDIHDGINVYSVSHILGEDQMKVLYDEVSKRGGEFSYRNLPNGERGVKEMHITWWSAINKEGDERFELQLRKFITSRAIAMTLAGIPAVYYLSLFGSKSDVSAYKKTKHGRDLNRTNFYFAKLAAKLANNKSREFKVFSAMMDLVEKRKGYRAFHPSAPQEILDLDPRVLSLVRGEGKDRVIALFNFSADRIELKYLEKNYALRPYDFIWQVL
ncbi:MAG: Sucrose phosphorylase [Microgenomates group bacterium GW2011_GWA2_44_7]|nr:MAG: Sucrose phosphorylase [Microgenomates group bacterium GW2011_GWA2_44_7]KKT77534.1 MAG: Sucrose phosphorylase [Microgenomates group bacterium GW2011_GWB1_44_8]